jgi:hypothetical protein
MHLRLEGHRTKEEKGCIEAILLSEVAGIGEEALLDNIIHAQ